MLGRGEVTHRVDGLSHVAERAGIGAAVMADAAIFDVPDRPAAPRQGLGQGPLQFQPRQVGPPAAPVDHHHQRMGPRALRAPQLPELQGIGSIGDPAVGVPVGEGLDIMPGQEFGLGLHGARGEGEAQGQEELDPHISPPRHPARASGRRTGLTMVPPLGLEPRTSRSTI
jgi:hypothetical protein